MTYSKNPIDNCSSPKRGLPDCFAAGNTDGGESGQGQEFVNPVASTLTAVQGETAQSIGVETMTSAVSPDIEGSAASRDITKGKVTLVTQGRRSDTRTNDWREYKTRSGLRTQPMDTFWWRLSPLPIESPWARYLGPHMGCQRYGSLNSRLRSVASRYTNHGTSKDLCYA